MRCLALAGFTIAIIVVPSLRAPMQTLIFDTVDDTYTVSFDPSKIAESQLRDLITYSPFITDYWNDLPNKDFGASGSITGSVPDMRFSALPLQLCIAEDRRYSNCEKNDLASSSFLRNAELNLIRSKRGLSWLEHLDHPRELNPVANYLTRWLSASIWMEERRLQYYSTWDERALKEVHDGVDPSELCSDVSTKLAAERYKEEKYRIVEFEWVNCALKGMDRQLGHYPVNDWNSFLKAYGITEEYKQKGPD